MDSNIFWIISGTSKMCTKYGCVHFFLYVECYKTRQENMEAYLKYMIVSYLIIWEIQSFHKQLTLSDMTNAEPICDVFLLDLVGPKAIGFS